mgnify:CR=1 FL=1
MAQKDYSILEADSLEREQLTSNSSFMNDASQFLADREDYYSDDGRNGLRECGNLLCAVPKREIVVSDETPEESYGTLKETSDEILMKDVRNYK